MNEPLVFWLVFLSIAAWAWQTTKTDFQTKLQNCLPWFILRPIQWYSLGLIFLSFFLFRSMSDIIKYDYINYNYLDPELFQNQCPPGTKPMLYHPFTRVISLTSPIAGCAAFLVIVYHASTYMKYTWKLKGKEYVDWLCNPVGFMPLLVIGMPMIFVVMAIRATIRMWAIMTCSGFVGFLKDDPSTQFSDVENLELATYQQDLAIASAFQFIAVWCFGLSCTHALSDYVKDGKDKHKLLQLSIMGVYAFTGIGLVRSLLTIAFAIIGACSPHLSASVGSIQTVISDHLDPAFLFATILCVVNMLILGKMDCVKEVLGNVNLKFNATRALLLIGQGQMAVLMALTSSGPSYKKITDCLSKVFKNVGWDFSTDQARLVHSSLLCFECLLVAILNLKFWDPEEILGNKNKNRAPLLNDAGP